MGYQLAGYESSPWYDRRGQVLGDATSLLIGAGANLLVPGSGPIVAASSGILSNLFGGNGRDAQRQARADWFTQAAKQGSVTAARILLGGLTNTAGNESPMYQKAIASLANSPVLQQAESLGPYWDTTDDNASTKMRARVESELQAAAGSSIATTTVIPTHTTMLPGMTSTASFNYLPYVLVGGGLLAVLALSGGRKRRSR